MKKQLLLSLFVLLNITLTAQYQHQFTFSTTSTSGSFEDITAVDSNGCIVAGSIYNGIDLMAYIARIDSNGTLLWDDEINLNHANQGFQIAKAPNNSFYFGGDYEAPNGVDNIFCTRYDSAGNQLWIKTYDSPGSFNPDQFNDMITDGSGNLYISGFGRITAPYTVPLILKYNSSGVLMDSVIINNSFTSKFHSIALSGSSIHTAMFKFHGNPTELYLSGFDANLNLTYSNKSALFPLQEHTVLAANPHGSLALGGQYSSKPGFCIYNTSGDSLHNVLIQGTSSPYGKTQNLLMDSTQNIYSLSLFTNVSSTIARHDTSGNLIWQDTIAKTVNQNVTNHDYFKLKDNKIYCAVSYINAHLYVYDTSGTRLDKAEIKLPGLKNINFAKLEVNDAGGVFLSGVARDSATNSKTNFVAYYSYTDTTSAEPIDTNTSSITEHISNFKIYPNPANEKINFTAPLQNITIYDTNGKVVYLRKSSTVELEILGLQSGAYILSGETQYGGQVTLKFLKE